MISNVSVSTEALLKVIERLDRFLDESGMAANNCVANANYQLRNCEGIISAVEARINEIRGGILHRENDLKNLEYEIERHRGNLKNTEAEIENNRRDKENCSGIIQRRQQESASLANQAASAMQQANYNSDCAFGALDDGPRMYYSNLANQCRLSAASYQDRKRSVDSEIGKLRMRIQSYDMNIARLNGIIDETKRAINDTGIKMNHVREELDRLKNEEYYAQSRLNQLNLAITGLTSDINAYCISVEKYSDRCRIVAESSKKTIQKLVQYIEEYENITLV